MANASTAAILKALDGLSLRAEATAQNIANANTPHYRPLRVSFEAALARALPHGSAAIDAVKPTLERVIGKSSDGEVRLDLELTTAAQTAARYAALVEVLGRQHRRETALTSGGY